MVDVGIVAEYFYALFTIVFMLFYREKLKGDVERLEAEIHH